MTPAEFYSTYLPMAQGVSQRTGLDPRLVLAQAALESGWGSSVPGGNLFGIKSHGQAGGRVVPTVEYEGGQYVPQEASFRTYASPEASFQDYGSFILENPRYQPVMAAKNLEDQIAAMGASGYATDPEYARKLSSIVRMFGADGGSTPMAPQPQPQRPQGLLEHIGLQRMGTGGPQGDIPFHQRDKFRGFAGRLAMAANTLRQRPDPNIPAAVQAAQQQRSGNRTAEWLAQQPGGEPYARMIEADPNAAASVLAAYQQSRAGASYKQVMGSDLGLTGEAAGRMFNVAPDGKITQVGGVAPTTIIGAGETEWEKGVGKAGVETLTTIQNEAAAAGDMIASANYLENLMRDPAFTSGALAEPQMAYKKIVEALGGDPANVGSLEAFQAVSSQMILDKMGGSLGAGFSEGDRKFVERMAPQLSTSPEGNRMILDMQRKVAERKIQIAEFADRYIEDEGMIDEKFMGALREWSKQNPLFEVVDASSYFNQ